MKLILLSAVLLLVAVNVLLGLPKAVNLIQTKALASNVPSNQTQDEVKAVSKPVQPPQSKQISEPAIFSSSALVEDLNSNTLLFIKDAGKPVPIASTTKIMTALVAVSHYLPNDVLTVTDESLVSGSTMGLKSGEQLSFRSLLYGMLLNSGNDAAYTIAANYPGGLPGFIKAMNDKAKELGLLNTQFDNPAGFDSPNHFSSAFDLSKIAANAVSDYQIARVVSTKETEVASLDKSVIHPLKNLNKLLDEPGVLGIKTGTTPSARENLVGLVERDGHKILTVVLGSDDRFGETQKLIDWAYSNFTW